MEGQAAIAERKMVPFRQEFVEVLGQEPVIPEHFILTLHAPHIAQHAEPGQFLMLRAEDVFDPFLRRPMSIMFADPKKKTVQVYFKAVGKGTQGLATSFAGRKLDMLGPLGIGFQRNPSKTVSVVIGGGYGVAPLYFLAHQIKKANKQNKIYALLGARNQNLLALDNFFTELKCELFVSTDDGSVGLKGNVLDLLKKVQGIETDLSQLQIYACGPHAMMQAIAKYAITNGISCQVSLEEAMACGFGICMGCVYPASNGGYKRVCTAGPVVTAEEVEWR